MCNNNCTQRYKAVEHTLHWMRPSVVMVHRDSCFYNPLRLRYAVDKIMNTSILSSKLLKLRALVSTTDELSHFKQYERN